MKELWKEIPNFSRYHCSNTGKLKTFSWKGGKETRILKPHPNHKGYLMTMLKRDDGKSKTVTVHRMVATTWLENLENKPEINHKNGIKTDNMVDNLEWCTQEENRAHAIENDLQYVLKGEEIGNSILTKEQVIEIREKFVPRIYGRDKLAQEYGVKPCTIKDVILRRSWKHI